MALNRLKQAASHVTGIGRPPHPLDPLSETEIENAVAIIRKEYSKVAFNAITLWEPPKKVMLQWVKDPVHTPRPNRVADVVCIGKGSKVFDGLVDLTDGKILSWEDTPDVQPLVRTPGETMFEHRLTRSRLPWRTSRLSSRLCAKTRRSLSSAELLAYLRRICTRFTAIVSTCENMQLFHC